MNNFFLAKEGFPILIVSIILIGLFYLINPWLSVIPGVFFLFSIFFSETHIGKLYLTKKLLYLLRMAW